MPSRKPPFVASPGAGFALAAAVLFGLSTPLAKLLLAQIEPSLLAGLLYLGSGLGLLVVARWERGQAEAPLGRSDYPYLVGSVLCGGIAGPLLLMLGLAHTSGGTASLALNLEGVLTTLLAWFVFGESVDRRIALGMACIVGGGSLLSWSDDATASWGLALIGLACLAWALDNNLTRGIAGGNPTQIALLKGLVAGVVNIAIARLAWHAAWPAWPVVAGAFVLGFACYGASLRLYVLALRHIGAARTGAYFALAPFIGAGLSIVVLGETPGLRLVTAAVLMGAGLLLHLTEHHEHLHAHHDHEHDHTHTHDDDHHDHEHHDHHTQGGVLDPKRPHSHPHRHAPRVHGHPHFPDLHHIHAHDDAHAHLEAHGHPHEAALAAVHGHTHGAAHGHGHDHAPDHVQDHT
jgi:drug/metabolite transporter (DMT)-like permease